MSTISPLQIYCDRSTATGGILAGLIAESTHNEQAASAIEEGLFLDRTHLIIGPIKEGIAAREVDADLDPEWTAEVIISLLWKRLITSPERINPEFSEAVLTTALGPVRQ